MKKLFSHPFILSLLIIAILVFFNYQGWLEAPQNTFFRLTASVQKIIYQFSLKINNFISFISSINKLDQKNNKLKQENSQLLDRLAQLQEIERENKFLREQIGLSSPEPKQLLLAEVIGQDQSNTGRYFLINKGRKEGVKEKAVVITAGNLLVGRVIEVVDSFSKVQSIIDPNSRVNARIQESAVTGLVKGDQKLNLIIDLLPQGGIIERGGTVVTSGLAGLFPAGLLIGQVQKIISFDVQISQIAEIKPAVDFDSLERVFVIRE
jgi:rod shape-determining protein MreC